MRRFRARPDATDAELLRAAVKSADAFRVVYERHAPGVYAVFARRTGDRDAALELTAETFSAAWLGRGRFEDRAGGSAAPWLFGIARNVLRRSVRRHAIEARARERLGLAIAAGEPAEPNVVWLEGFDDDLEAALASLGVADRHAVMLRVVEDLGYDDVATALGITPGAARVRVFRALARLRRHLVNRPQEVPNEH